MTGSTLEIQGEGEEAVTTYFLDGTFCNGFVVIVK